MPIHPPRRVVATRYVTPLREGGSLPAVVEADDLGLYVVKFRGAGQGLPVLVAELLVGELGRALGLPVPEIVAIDIDPDLARTEPDGEIQDLLKASGGLNLALDFLPGALPFNPGAPRGVDADLAARIVWFDAFVMNVDRTPRNPNLLVWHNRLWLIDHGAALYVHHAWNDPDRVALSRFAMIKDHVLLPFAGDIRAAGEDLSAMLGGDLVDEALAAIPDELLGPDVSPFSDVASHREAYRRFLTRRFDARAGFIDEAVAAQGVLAGTGGGR
jgi:hypothetical protein